MGFHTKEECTRGQECDVPSHRPDPTTEAMHERNVRADGMSEMLKRIWLLCAGGNGESALTAAERIITSRNSKLSELSDAYEAIKANVAGASKALGASAWMIDGSDLAERCEREVTMRRMAENRAAGASAELDIARRTLEEYKRASTVVPTSAAEYKTAKEELERLRAQLAEMTKQRNNAGDDWRHERERSREVVDVLSDYAIERVKLKRQLELEARQHEAQWDSDKERLRAQEAKIRDLERQLSEHVPARAEFERLEADNKRLRDQDAILRGNLDHARQPADTLAKELGEAHEHEQMMQPVIDAVAAWAAPFGQMNLNDPMPSHLVALSSDVRSAYKTFAEWCEARTGDDDIPF